MRIADRVSLRWLYPAILLGWSAVGFMTGWVSNYPELFLCRVLLGFFEAGQWPCALAAAQRLLPRAPASAGQQHPPERRLAGRDRHAADHPALEPAASRAAGGCRFRSWARAGLRLDRRLARWRFDPRDLDITRHSLTCRRRDPLRASAEAGPRGFPVRRFLALVVVVITINLCWQYFRAWMPMMLENQYGYSKGQTQNFSSLYYLVAGVGCLLAGFVVKWLAGRGWPVHRARMAIFAVCVLLTAASMVTALLPASWMMLGTLLVIGFGSLGQFPTYYAFTQELSVRQMGKVTGALSFMTWTSTAFVQGLIGRWIDRTGSYSAVTCLAGLVPGPGLAGIAAALESQSPITGRVRPVSREAALVQSGGAHFL